MYSKETKAKGYHSHHLLSRQKRMGIRQLSSLFDSLPENIKYYLPTMQHIFISLNRIEEGQIETIRDAMMAAAVMAQKWRINPVKLAVSFKNIF